MDCTIMTTAEGCMYDSDNGMQQGVVIHYQYGKDASGNLILHKTRYTDAAGVPIALTATQVVTAGVCQPVATDVEWQLLADDTDGDPATAPVQFLRKYTRITNTLNGTVISETVGDFELDMVTPYTVVGTAGAVGNSDTEFNDLTLCDATGTAFIRRVTYVNGVQVSIGDFELDGTTAFTPSGAVSACPNCAPVTAQGVVATWG